MKKLTMALCSAVFLFTSCIDRQELTLEEIEQAREAFKNYLVQNTVTKPYEGQEFVVGKSGGVWNTVTSGEPKSFNMLIAERDGTTAGMLSELTEYLVDYDVLQKKWIPGIADFEVKVDEQNQTMDVVYTLRNDLYWSFYGNSQPKVNVTSDDVVFWYDEICCDKSMGSSSYNSQFMPMEDGSVARVSIEKISRYKFVFHLPRVVAEPLLTTNMDFGPAFIYKKAKDEGGAEKVKSILTVDTDPKTIPSMGKYFITSYVPGQKLVYEKNPDYWQKDSAGQSVNYPEMKIVQIVREENTNYLLFQQGKIETYSPAPEQIYDAIEGQKKYDYTVFNAEGKMTAPFWSFNQNPKHKGEPFYDWFCKKEFRQAMSCLLNRDRICWQVYRTLAQPVYGFFPKMNAFYNEDITLQYRYDRKHALSLLEGIGFKIGPDGFMLDDKGRKVEFDLTIDSSAATISDIAQIIVDECKKAGITVNVRQLDFQALVERLTDNYNWQSIIIGLGGSNIFPTQGSNVWVSSGNLHLWNPLQETPATDWEARVDYLYNEAKCLVDVEKARPLWEEYQKIFLEQCPIIYLCGTKSFFAINNRWDLSNVYYDNVNGAEITHVFIKN